MKLKTITFFLLIATASFVFAQEKSVTNVSKPAVVSQQSSNKGLLKQTTIRPRPQSNWSKIKDLFM